MADYAIARKAMKPRGKKCNCHEIFKLKRINILSVVTEMNGNSKQENAVSVATVQSY